MSEPAPEPDAVPPSAAAPALARVVGVPGAVFMGLGSILGTGVFVSVGIAAGVAGPSVVLAILFAGLVATFNGLSSAQLAASHPVSGGTYEYGYRYLTPTLGFLAGWLFLCAKSASAATAALGCAGYLLHAAGLAGSYPQRVGLGLVALVALTLLVAGGIGRSSRVNALVVSLTLVALGAFVVAGFPQALERGAEHLAGVWPPAKGWRALLEASALMFVAFTGYGRIATLGEEVAEPRRTIPRAIVAALLGSALVYAAVAGVALAAAGSAAVAGATQGAAAPLEVVARGFGVPGVAPLVALGAVSAMLGVLLNLILGLSRVVLAMARRRDLPARLGVVDPLRASPRAAVFLVGAIVAGLVATGDVKATWSFSAFTVLVYYALTNLAALRLAPEDRRFPRAVSVLGLASCLGLAFWVDPRAWGAGLGLLALGLAWRGAWRRWGAGRVEALVEELDHTIGQPGEVEDC